MQQNVNVITNNRGCCGGIVGGVLLIVVIALVAGALGRVFEFLFSLPGVILLIALAVGAAVIYNRRQHTT